jgi:LPS-assembly protein
MIWFSTFSPPYYLFRVLSAAVVAASLPALALAQTNVQPARKIDDKDAPATVRAEQITGRPDREIHMERDVEIIHGTTTINADAGTYHIVEDEVEAHGNVRMQRLGDHYTGESLRLKVDEGKGYVESPTYKIQHNNAQGVAQRIDFEAEDRAVVTEGTYSTCEGTDPDWYLKSATMHLDTGREVGNSSRTVVYFKGVPILAAPAMSFPLSDARKSGFLPPTQGHSNKGGIEITVPYYWNIAPNRDVTLYPKIITQRGLQLGADARYLGAAYSGQTKVEALFGDTQTRTNRYAIASTHAQTLAPGLTFALNLNAASDDDYPNDFPGSITTSSQRLLLRDISMNYAATYWNAGVRVSNYQVLQDPAAPIARPYDRLPQLTFQAVRKDVYGFDLLTDAELTNFWHPDLVRGKRLVINPKVSWPIIAPGYFLTPKLSLHATQYSLDNAVVGSPSTLTRVLPTLSLDSGLVFERETRFFGKDVTQTLEPRLFYVRTPYHDQSLYPNFDTAEADLSFAQIFSENRFIGSDRISDANQLTAALVSRYIEPSGAERLRLAVGQRYYFEEQRVTLGAVRNESQSDLLVSGSGKLSSTFTADTNLQYSQSLKVVNRANYGVTWQPAPKRVLNLQYRRDLPNSLEQFDVSGQWPIANRWYGVGRLNYSLPNSQVVEGLIGMEYKADCWIFRIVGQRIPTGTNKAASTIFFQLELSGLTRLGSNPLAALRTSIPGYQPVNQSYQSYQSYNTAP